MWMLHFTNFLIWQGLHLNALILHCSPIGGWCMAVTAIMCLINGWVRVFPQSRGKEIYFALSLYFEGRASLTYPYATRWLSVLYISTHQSCDFLRLTNWTNDELFLSIFPGIHECLQQIMRSGSMLQATRDEMTKIIKTCTKPLQRGHRKLHFYALNNVCSHMNNEYHILL